MFKVKFLAFVMIIFIYYSCNKKVNTANSAVKEQAELKAVISDSTGLWKDIILTSEMAGDGTIKPDKFRSLSLDFEKMKGLLSAVAHEKDKQNKQGFVINIPMPEGNYEQFGIYETEVMAPELAAKFPEIKTYGGNGIQDKTMSIRLDINPGGFHAMIISLKGAINIDPYSRNSNSRYISYYKHDYNPPIRERFEIDSIK